MRILLGAFGDPGHAFPVIALGRALSERGHEVVLQTWQRWLTDVEALGMRFEAAPEYHVFPTRERPLSAPLSQDLGSHSNADKEQRQCRPASGHGTSMPPPEPCRAPG